MKRRQQVYKAMKWQQLQHLLQYIDTRLDILGELKEEDIPTEDMWSWYSGQLMALSNVALQTGNERLYVKALGVVCTFTDAWNAHYLRIAGLEQKDLEMMPQDKGKQARLIKAGERR